MKKNPDAKVPASNLAELKKKAMTDLWTGIIGFF